MTDIIITVPAHQSAIRFPRLRTPLLVLANAFGSVSGMFGRALEMAYVAPYKITARRDVPLPDSCPDGRDPRW